MSNVDVSTYPKPPPFKSSIETVKDLGSLQQQKQQIDSGALTIDKQKLDLVNQRFAEMAKGFTALANDPNLSNEAIDQYIDNQVKLGYVPPEMAAKTKSMLPRTQDKAKLKSALEQHLAHAQSTVEAINFQYGTPGTMNVGNAQQPIRTSPRFGIQSTALPIATQQGPDTPEFDENGQPRYRGVQGAVAAPGMATAPPPAPGAPVPQPTPRPSLPIDAGTPANEPLAARISQAESAVTGARGAMTAPPPGFAEGLKQRTEDQNTATAKMQAVKPAVDALKLMDKGITSGPGTEQWTNMVAALKAWGLVDIKDGDDPTVLRQKITKKLAQYVGNSPVAARSDAAQLLVEAGSPNPKAQLLPALKDLTRDAIILDRVEAARPNAFDSKKMADYGKHRSSFPQSIDERAFGLDLMEPAKARALIKRMGEKYRSNPKDTEALKFLNSLDIAKKQGFFTPADILND